MTSARDGISQSELIRMAIGDFLAKRKNKNDDWKKALKKVKGMWNDRDDIQEEFREIRKSADRNLF